MLFADREEQILEMQETLCNDFPQAQQQQRQGSPLLLLSVHPCCRMTSALPGLTL